MCSAHSYSVMITIEHDVMGYEDLHGGPYKRKPTFGGHFEILPGVIFLFVHIFVKYRYFDV